MSQFPFTERFEMRQSIELESISLQGKSSFSSKLFGVLHLPLSKPPFPTVLMIHGFAGTKVGRHRLYVRLAEALSKQGIASLRIDMRGCGDSEGSFTDLTIETQLQDVLSALKFLNEHPSMDAQRLGLLGRSMGGAISVLAAARARQSHVSSIRSMALWCPLFDAKPWLVEASKKQSMQLIFQGERISPMLLQQLACLDVCPALQNLRDIPFLFAHSLQDPVVTIEHTHRYLEQRASFPDDPTAETRFLPFQGKDHEFSLPDEQTHLLEESSQWFQKTLCCHKKEDCIIQTG